MEGVINHFANTIGKYNNVNNQIIEEAKRIIEGSVLYDFNNTYEFGNFWDLVLLNGRYSLGDSTVSGVFDGDVQKEKISEAEYLVVSGIISYSFSDAFTDPFEKVEWTQVLQGVSREEAEEIVGSDADEEGTPYDIMSVWQTKFNATVRVK